MTDPTLFLCPATLCLCVVIVVVVWAVKAIRGEL